MLADYAGFSRYTLSRMFSRHTGATFIQYLNARRVDMAAEMLSQSDLPVTQVALRVGFGSIATFNRVYAKPVSKCVSGAEKIADIKSRFHNIGRRKIS